MCEQCSRMHLNMQNDFFFGCRRQWNPIHMTPTWPRCAFFLLGDSNKFFSTSPKAEVDGATAPRPCVDFCRLILVWFGGKKKRRRRHRWSRSPRSLSDSKRVCVWGCWSDYFGVVGCSNCVSVAGQMPAD